MRNACEMQLVLCFISSSGLFVRRNFWINLTVSAVKWRTQSSQFPLAQSRTKVFNYLPMLYRLAKRKREREKEKHMVARERERSIMRGTIFVLQFRFCRLPNKIKVSVSVAAAAAVACNAANFSQSLQLQCKVANLTRETARKGGRVGRVL